jgi:hypothetical protein
VVRSPLHSVVDFPRCRLLRRLAKLLIHFPFGIEVDGAIFGVVVGFPAVTHAIWRFHCVRASFVAPATVRSSASSCIGGIFDRKLLGFFPAKALQSSFPSSLVVCHYQNQCFVWASGNCTDYHCNVVSELHLVL